MLRLLGIWILTCSMAWAGSLIESDLRVYVAKDSQVLPNRYLSIPDWLEGLTQVEQVTPEHQSYWLVKQIVINEPDHWLVNIDGSMLQKADIYLFSEANQLYHRASGYNKPSPHAFSYAATIDTPTLGGYWLIVRVYSPFYTGQPDVSMQPESEFAKHQGWRLGLTSLGLGGILVFALYHLVLAGLERQWRFVHSGLFILVFSALIVTRFELERSMLSLYSMQLYPLLSLSLPLFSALMFNSYLKPGKEMPLVGYSLLLLPLASIVAMALYSQYPAWFATISQFMRLLTGAIGAWIIALACYLRKPYAKVFAASFVFWLLAISCLFSPFSSGLGLSPQLSEMLGIGFASFGVMVFTLGLGQQYRRWQMLSQDVKQELENERKQARLDPLTGLSNRFAFEEFLNQQNGKETLCLALADINSLRQLNETEGHQKGDQLICLVADTMELVFKNKAQVFRIRGDKFAIVSHQLGKSEMLDQLGLVNKIARLNSSERTGLSLGCAYKKKSDDRNLLFYQADNALRENQRQRKTPCEVLSIRR